MLSRIYNNNNKISWRIHENFSCWIIFGNQHKRALFYGFASLFIISVPFNTKSLDTSMDSFDLIIIPAVMTSVACIDGFKRSFNSSDLLNVFSLFNELYHVDFSNEIHSKHPNGIPKKIWHYFQQINANAFWIPIAMLKSFEQKHWISEVVAPTFHKVFELNSASTKRY